MANYKRKRSRLQASGYYSRNGLDYRLGSGVSRRKWMSNYPRHWDKVHHTRPRRARTRQCETAILRGADPDEVIWPEDRKPHIYYF